jgi:hypothetical protein
VFRADDLPSALRIWSAMLGQGPGGAATGWSGWASCLLLLVIAWFAPNTQQIMQGYRPGLGSEQAGPPGWPGAPITWRPGLISALVVGTVLAAPLYFVVFTDRVSDFLYFRF